MKIMTRQSVWLNSPPFYSDRFPLLSACVRRSRGYYLYSVDGRRIFDMYLANGRLCFGHKPLQIAKQSKEAIDQGLLMDLPHRYQRQLLQWCARVYKNYRFFSLFPSLTVFMRTFRLQPFVRMRSVRIFDPAYYCVGNKTQEADGCGEHHFLAYHRPTLPIPSADILLPLLPIPHVHAVQLVCSKKRLSMSNQMQHASALDTLSVIEVLRTLDSGIVKCVYSGKRTDIIDPAQERQHTHVRCWKSSGYYLHTRLSYAKYGKLYAALLRNDILINPDYRGVTLLPLQMPKKEYLKFVRISDSM